MTENFTQNKKNLIIIVSLLILALAIIFFSQGNGSDETESQKASVMDSLSSIETSSTTSTSDLPVVIPTQEETPVVVTSASIEPIASVVAENGVVTNVIMVPSEPTHASSSIAEKGTEIVAQIGTLSDEDFKKIEPDLIKLIEALRALVIDLQRYVDRMRLQ